MYKKQKSADINRIKKSPLVFVHFTDQQILLAKQGDLFHYLIILISRSKILDFPAYFGGGLLEMTGTSNLQPQVRFPATAIT